MPGVIPHARIWARPGAALAPVMRDRSARALAAVALVGLVLRAGWFVADPCVWWDEAMLILNVLNKPFAALAGPLDYNQAAPPAFLWAVKACVAVLGDGTHALRLVPFAASCAGFLLLFAVGGGYPRRAVLAAVVLVAGSSKVLGHTAELKPYTLDFCAAAAVAVWFCRSAPAGRAASAALVCPAVVLLVYPGCLIAGGALLGLAAGARTRGEWLRLVLAGALTLVAFGLLLAGPGGAQQTPGLRAYWADLGHFPNWARPWALPGWALSGVGGIFRYCLYPAGTLLAPFAVAGFVSLWRGGRRDVAVFLLAPLALALGAGLVGKYPFGGSRLHLYAAPGLALLTAAGLRAAWDRLAARPGRVAAAGRVALVAVTGWGVLEGASLPLAGSARVDVRPAAEYLKARPAGEPVRVTDHVFAYYLRRDPAVGLLLGPLPDGPVWVAGTFDPKAPDPVLPFVTAQNRPFVRADIGPGRVFRFDPK